MNPLPAQTTRSGRLWLVGALALVVAPNLLRLPLWLAALPAGLIGWYLLRERYGWHLPGTLLRVLVVGVGIAGIGYTHHTIFGREAGVSLLALLLAMKLMELRTLRDATLLTFLGYFLVAGALLFDQSLLSGSYLVIAVLALTGSALALHHPDGTLGDARHYLRSAAGLLLQGIPLAIVLFLLFPRLPGPLWNMPQDRYAARTGLSDEINLGTISELANSPEIAFRARFEGPPPRSDQLYWRGPVLWHTDGRRWSRLQPFEEQLLDAPHVEPEGAPVRYSVVFEPSNLRSLIGLDLPAGPVEGTRLTPDFQLVTDKPIGSQRFYTATSYIGHRAGETDLQALEYALALPTRANPRSRELAGGWAQEGLAGEALVRRAIAYFREQPFVYTRMPPRLGANPVDAFLFDTRRGFCEHYAVAFTTLMRAGGVPARVVTGYQGGQLNAVGNYLVVSQSDAHAWAEVWLDGQGWVRVDPTAAVPNSRVESEADAGRFAREGLRLSARQEQWLQRAWRTLGDSWDALDHAWTEWVLGYGPEQQQNLLRALGLLERGWPWVVAAMFGLLGVFVLAISMLLLRRRPPPRDPVARIWDRFCAKLARHGLVRAAGEGPLDYGERVSRARPDLAEAVRGIVTLYTALRYAPPDPAALQRELAQRVRGFSP